ncbi:hypothetical protein AB0F68_10375 [Micromonospora sp. NPDC023966]|uniref:hypothetical protein n=1 Tax=Micromonospora sp. NPDC023966 TaxID=3154699 RepID=UPI0033F26D24
MALAALMVGVVSLLTARSSLRVARETFKRAGPTVAGEADCLPPGLYPLTIFLTLHNAGLAPVDVDRLTLVRRNPLYDTDATSPFSAPMEPQPESEHERSLTREAFKGPQLPHRLEPGSSAMWRLPIKDFAGTGSTATEDWEFVARSAMWLRTSVKVYLGNGSQVEIPLLARLAELYFVAKHRHAQAEAKDA